MNKFKSKYFTYILCFLLLFLIVFNNNLLATIKDKFTHSNYLEARSKKIFLDLTVDFTNKQIFGNVIHDIENLSGVDSISLDIARISIESVYVDNTISKYSILKKEFGEELRIPILKTSKKIKIIYKTINSEGLQWLSSDQTFDKTSSFLSTEGQAILNRTWIPCQDTPDNKITYEAKIKVPRSYLALMSANNNPRKKNDKGEYYFKMDFPIPTYLISLAVGNLSYRSLDSNHGIYAENSILDNAQINLKDIPKFYATGMKYFGPSALAKCDLLILPYAFPYGGMENPFITYVTSTSLENPFLYIHETSHSWGGNLVTPDNWGDFWLNESITVYIERKIQEKLFGKEFSDMSWELGYSDLKSEIQSLKENNSNKYIALKCNNIDYPDDIMTAIAYEKGAFLLREIENIVGEESILTFFRSFFKTFAFKTINSKDFINYTTNYYREKKLEPLLKKWIYKETLPEIKKINSIKFRNIENLAKNWKNLNASDFEKLKSSTTYELIHFMRSLPIELSFNDIINIELKLNFKQQNNLEIKYNWTKLLINKNSIKFKEQIINFLKSATGRRKFLVSTYIDLAQTQEGYILADSIFEILRTSYHPVTVNSISPKLREIGFKFSFEEKKKSHELELNLEKEKHKKEIIIRYSLIAFITLFSVLLYYIFKKLRLTRKQKKTIEEQKNTVSEQKSILEEKNKEITDSINYAKRIQTAILPPAKLITELLPQSFVLYKPKDIVAGDFYWLEKKGETVLFAACDCTGHGVPGAMVSVICNNGLNRSVREHNLTDPGKILDKTREIVIQEFEKSEEEVKDGMDVSLLAINGNAVKWSGANNPLWLIRNGELIEYKANKQPIGKYADPKPFTTNDIAIQKGDSLYIFTDGLQDQFGGEKGKKFKASKLKELLLSVQDKSMDQQIQIIEEVFEQWKGNLEQNDDICLIGISL